LLITIFYEYRSLKSFSSITFKRERVKKYISSISFKEDREVFYVSFSETFNLIQIVLNYMLKYVRLLYFLFLNHRERLVEIRTKTKRSLLTSIIRHF
ncbi:hypothetical protein DXT76_11955, partial [Halobacillus trueperi]